MASTTNTSFGAANSGVQTATINGNFTAHIHESESLDSACLRDLRTTNPSHDKDRIQSTNGGLLKDSYCWILDNEKFKEWKEAEGSRLLWIRGDPGKGKTMLLCGIIDELAHIQSTESSANNTIAFFFCQATDERLNNATAVLRGLTYSLVETHPSLLSHVRNQYDQAGKALFEDRNAWNALLRILKDVLKDPALQSTCLIIDALDECTTGLDALLDFIVTLTESPSYSHVKLIVSSRNWLEIEERLDATSSEISLISLETNTGSVSEAVNRFVLSKVNHLTKVKRYSDGVRDAIYKHLSPNSQDTFLWVALVCQSLEKTPKRHALKKLEVFPPGLDALYYRMLDQVGNSEDSGICFQILAAMSIVYRPISLDEMTFLIDVSGISDLSETLPEIVATCGSFLTLREGIVTFIHQSAKDFILGDARDRVFFQSKEAEHYAVFSRSLQAMFKVLRRNIFGLSYPGFPIEKVKLPESNPLAGLHYACVHWVDHLHDSWDESPVLDRESRVDLFLRHKFLHWLEALSLLNSMHHGIVAMLTLEDLFQYQSKSLRDRIQDASRFIIYHRLAIETAPLQAYSSTLIFSPRQSVTKISYEKERSSWILNEPVTEKYWSSCLQTLEGHSSCIESVAWSPDQTHLASGAADGLIKIWNSDTGLCESTFELNCLDDFAVISLAWSPDGVRLASGLDTGRIVIWDLSTSQYETSLEGHKRSSASLLWLQDGRLISGSFDCTIKIWDTTTGSCISTLEGHTDAISSIAWLQDKSRLASGSSDETIRIWDLVTGQCESILEGCTRRGVIESIGWIDNRNRLASGSDDGTIEIWDLGSGLCESTLEGHEASVNSLAWANDRNQLASGSDDGTINLWNLVTGQCESTLEGHSEAISSIDWAQDGSRLASGSYDDTIRIWSPSSGQNHGLSRQGCLDKVRSITWSEDGLKLASTSADQIIKIWDPVTGNCDLDLEPEFENDYDQPFEVYSVLWSSDGIRLAAIYDTSLVGIWNLNLATGECELVLEKNGGPIVWSQDGNRIASVTDCTTIHIWDMGTGQCEPGLTLEGNFDDSCSIVWSRDGSRLLSSSGRDNTTVEIWNTVTGDCVSTFARDSSLPWSTAWFENRLAFVSGYLSINIWDPATEECESIPEGYTKAIKSLLWSRDGNRLASSSEDETIKVWDLTTGHCQPQHGVGCNANVYKFDEFDLRQLHKPVGPITVKSGYFEISKSSSSSASSSSELEQSERYTLSRDMSWIAYNGLNLLWLPVEYRPTDYSLLKLYNSTLAIGCASGQVIFLAFKEQGPDMQGT